MGCAGLRDAQLFHASKLTAKQDCQLENSQRTPGEVKLGCGEGRRVCAQDWLKLLRIQRLVLQGTTQGMLGEGSRLVMRVQAFRVQRPEFRFGFQGLKLQVEI